MMTRKKLFKGFVLTFLLVSVIDSTSAETQAERDFYSKIPNFDQMKLDFSAGAASFRHCNVFPFFCIPNIPCDSVLRCVMKQQRESLKARLEDLRKTIEANAKQTKHQTKIIEKEVLAYRRLLERVKKENISLKRAVHLSNKISQSQALGTTINTVGKGKQ